MRGHGGAVLHMVLHQCDSRQHVSVATRQVTHMFCGPMPPWSSLPLESCSAWSLACRARVATQSSATHSPSSQPETRQASAHHPHAFRPVEVGIRVHPSSVHPRAILPVMARRLSVPLYHVDAFAEAPLTGNPAAVALLPFGHAAGDDTLLAVAAELNLSETAFLTVRGRVDVRPRCYQVHSHAAMNVLALMFVLVVFLRANFPCDSRSPSTARLPMAR